MTDEGPKLTPQEQADIQRILAGENPERVREFLSKKSERDRLEKLEMAFEASYIEQKAVNARNMELLTEIGIGLKAMQGDERAKAWIENKREEQPVTPEKLKGFVKGPAPAEKGKIVGCCRECGCTVRCIPAGPHHINLCPQCGVLVDDGVLYGTPCADCPHPSGGHPGGGKCVVEIGMDAGEPVRCKCLGFAPRREAQTETEERKALIQMLTEAPEVTDEMLSTIRATLPAIVVYRAFHEVLETNKGGVGPSAAERIRLIGRHFAAAHTAMLEEHGEIKNRKREAEKQMTAPEEHEFCLRKIGALLASGKPRSHPDILELTRKVGDAWNRMSSAEKKAAKDYERRARKFVEEGAGIHSALEAILGPPEEGAEGYEYAEKVLAPKMKRLENQDEERKPMTLTFMVTRSQVATLEWGLDHPESMGVKPGMVFKTVEELATVMMAPSLNYMLRHIAIARAQATTQAVKLPEGKLPVTDGQGGPVVGQAVTRRDRSGNLVADVTVMDPAMMKKLNELMKPQSGFSIGGHVREDPKDKRELENEKQGKAAQALNESGFADAFMKAKAERLEKKTEPGKDA